jgi:hypothetical protein
MIFNLKYSYRFQNAEIINCLKDEAKHIHTQPPVEEI